VAYICNVDVSSYLPFLIGFVLPECMLSLFITVCFCYEYYNNCFLKVKVFISSIF